MGHYEIEVTHNHCRMSGDGGAKETWPAADRGQKSARRKPCLPRVATPRQFVNDLDLMVLIIDENPPAGLHLRGGPREAGLTRVTVVRKSSGSPVDAGGSCGA
jgi:hypothetical protein